MQTNLIKTIYLNFSKKISNFNYFDERIILTIINVDVDRINNVYIKQIRNNF